jgi:hypothetical protein
MKVNLNSLHRGRPSGRPVPMDGTAPAADEPCLSCGEPTAVGTYFFSDRRDVLLADGTKIFLCADCQSQAHRARKGEPLSDEDLRIIAGNGGLIGVGLLSGGGGI